MNFIKFLFFLLEGVSVIAAFYYAIKNPWEKSIKLLAYFLLFTFFTETIGFIPRIIYNQESLQHLKETLWYSNYWLFNPYLVISFSVYVFYFNLQLQRFHLKRILNIGVCIFVVTSIINLIFSDVFFVTYSAYTFFFGILLLFMSVSFYYYELMISNKLLQIKKSVPFYVSISFLLFNLICMPLWIFMRFYSNTRSPEFVNVYRYIFLTANYLLYSTYTFAFIYCAQKKQHPELAKIKQLNETSD